MTTTVQVQFGGRSGEVHELETNEDLVVVRTTHGGPIAEAKMALTSRSRSALKLVEPVVRFPAAGVEVFHVRSGGRAARDEVRRSLEQDPLVRFAGRVLADPVYRPSAGHAATTAGAATQKEPVIYTENVFVKFEASVKDTTVRRILAAHKLDVKRKVGYIDNAWFVQAPRDIGLDVFPLALELLRKQAAVEFCHPELIRRRELRGAFPQQWHLARATVNGTVIDAHANVKAAWRLSRGRGVVIAVIDDGVDIDHAEFQSRDKIVHPLDATPGAIDRSDPRPRGLGDNHGTACAGVACADGRKGAAGVAPAARLMPIRLSDDLGSQGEADAFAWAADHGADVISCSWGPPDGEWWNPKHPGHRARVALSDNTRLALEYAISKGRNGKGCVVCFAAGNGNESADNDGYVSHPGVIAVAACNDTGTRSVYSDTGKALWCAFPSNDFDLAKIARLPSPRPQGGVWNEDHPKPKTKGIWTTDRSGWYGYNRGASGDAKGDYTDGFGGTSSAAPGVAGVAALVLARNPGLRQEEVRDILKRACDEIDTANGAYDPATGHSRLYGYGRINARKAVELAKRPHTKSSRPKKMTSRNSGKRRAS
jgi:subtilisin family serine protease